MAQSIPSDAITVSVVNASPTSVATSGDTALPVQFGLRFNVGQSDLTGVSAEIPLNWTPTPGNAPYADFTMDEPFFALDETKLPAVYDEETNPNSLISSYDISADRLIIHLRDNMPTGQRDTGIFYVNLNTNYLNKIPTSVPLWTVTPEIWQEGTKVNTATGVTFSA
ncbi:MAG: hypothetical protein LBN34_10080, partial [Clostridiales Family XIII bacterium]|nr:hypothetical protein [Clostridiales Family XIII bacterium]